jgi:hypothetical protein
MNTQEAQLLINPDLMKYPSTIETLSLDQWYTIGDLHSNPLKLLYFMIHVGAASMNAEDYEAYAKLYASYPPPDKNQFEDMEALLVKVNFMPGASIRLIGDVFADRGRDDAAVVSLIYRFKKAGGLMEIMLSNHDGIFIPHMEAAIYQATHNEKGEETPFDQNKFITTFNKDINTPVALDDPEYTVKINYFYRSIIGLQASLKEGIITPAALIQQYNTYKNTLKVFSYDYPEELNGEPVEYGHSAFSKLNVIFIAQQIRKFLVPEFTASLDAKIKELLEKTKKGELTDKDILPLIKKINEVLSERAQKDNIHKLLLTEEGKETDLSYLIANLTDPNDNDICQTHGHTTKVFGKRNTLDSVCGQEVSPGNFATAHLPYTKTYKTPELAKTAYAKLVGVATSNLMMLSEVAALKRPIELNTVTDTKKQHIMQ